MKKSTPSLLANKRHQLLMALFWVCWVLPHYALAVGLGEISVSSALNDRLAAEVELLGSQGLKPGEAMVSLASKEDFARIGVERYFYLTDIKFQIDEAETGLVVKLTSGDPITEPFLNFVVEVLWPQGKLLKEYTVLLDPPTFTATTAQSIVLPDQIVQREPLPGESQESVASKVTQSTGLRQLPGEGVMTTRADTLSEIAGRTRPSDRVTLNQQMLAIQAINPRAFLRNNINLLKAGYRLALPSESQALETDPRTADLEVAAQAAAWRNPQPAADVDPTASVLEQLDNTGAQQLSSQVDATSAGQSANAPAAAGQGEVRIIANSGEFARGSVTLEADTFLPEEAKQLIDDKAVLMRKVDELSYQLDREGDIAANQIAIKNRQLEIKNAEIAQLQQQMKELRQRIAADVAQPVESAQSAQEQSPWWRTIWILVGLAFVLALLLLGARMQRQRARGRTNATLDPDLRTRLVGDAVEPANQAPLAEQEIRGSEHQSADLALDEQALREPDASQDEQPQTTRDTHSATPVMMNPLGGNPNEENEPAGEAQVPADDVMGEAEIYMAYGRYGQAATLLAEALVDQPNRWEVRLKLLEVCVEANDQLEFDVQRQYLAEHCHNEDVLAACRSLEEEFKETHIDLRITNLAHAESQNETSEYYLEDMDLELDDLSTEDFQLAPVSEAGGSEFELEFDAEFDDRIASGAGQPAIIDHPEDERHKSIDFGTNSDHSEPEIEPGFTTAFIDEEQSENYFSSGDISDVDINTTKLDLAEAYIDMGDAEGAREILREVLDGGSAKQQTRATELLDGLNN